MSSDSAGMANHKAALRLEMRLKIASLAAPDIAAWSARIRDHLRALPAYEAAHRVMLFWPIEGEVDLRPLASEVLSSGRELVLPRAVWSTKDLEPCLVTDPARDLVPGRHGILEPGPLCAQPTERIDLVVTPGLAFDRQCGRLGRGAGFYDRFLARSRVGLSRVVGVAFGVQVVERVPLGQDDQRVDEVWTEAGRVDAEPAS